MYSPNMGLAFGSPAALSRQNFLSSSNIEPVKKRPVNFPAGSPAIGSKRTPINYERPAPVNQDDCMAAISTHENVRNITTSELRVEDYFHMRTAPASSDLYKTANNLGAVSSFSRALLNTAVKEPNLDIPAHSQQLPQPNAHPLTASGASSSNVYHTPADRLGLIGRRNFTGQEISSSIRSMQENSFNCNLNANAYRPIVEPHYGAQQNSPQQNLLHS